MIDMRIVSQNIVLKKYLEKNEMEEISELEKICINEDKVNLKLELEYRMEIERDYNKDLNNINEILYYLNEKLIGYAGISYFGGDAVEINGLVHPRFRRRGIFTKIIELALEECRKRNLKEVLLLGDDKSVSAIRFIEKTKATYTFSECRMTCLEWEEEETKKEIILVKAKNENTKDIDNLNNIFFGQTNGEIILPEEEEKNNHITYLINLDGNIIGKIKVSIEMNLAFISGFGIIPKYRGNGYGKSALISILNKLKNEKISKVELDVEIKNKNALNLYKSCGLKEGSIMNYYRINND